MLKGILFHWGSMLYWCFQGLRWKKNSIRFQSFFLEYLPTICTLSIDIIELPTSPIINSVSILKQLARKLYSQVSDCQLLSIYSQEIFEHQYKLFVLCLDGAWSPLLECWSSPVIILNVECIKSKLCSKTNVPLNI